MRSKAVRFRTRLFGGFDRRDVIFYIKELSEERNGLRDDVKDAEEREQFLDSKLAKADLLIEEARREAREFKVTELDSASDALRRLEEKYSQVGDEIRKLRLQVEDAGMREKCGDSTNAEFESGDTESVAG